jgi:hypothetical protein
MIRCRYILLVIIVFTCFSWIACEKERDPCLQPTITTLRFGTYQPADTGSAGRDSVLPSAIVGLVDTPVLWFYGFKSSKFASILSPLTDSTRWYIVPDSNDRINGRDTITFYYQKRLQFLSTGCGYTYYYTLKDVVATNRRIDSVKINSYDVTGDAKIEHVKIFY